MNRNNMPRALLIAAALGLGLGATACKKEEPASTMDKAEENVKDAFDARPNEPLKDAAEDMKSAAENAGEAVEQKADQLQQGGPPAVVEPEPATPPPAAQ